MSFCSVYVTCANILPGIESIYWWEGRVQADNEVALIAKTLAELLDAVIAKVWSLHSYTCPCVVAWPIAAGHPPISIGWPRRQWNRRRPDVTGGCPTPRAVS